MPLDLTYEELGVVFSKRRDVIECFERIQSDFDTLQIHLNNIQHLLRRNVHHAMMFNLIYASTSKHFPLLDRVGVDVEWMKRYSSLKSIVTKLANAHAYYVNSYALIVKCCGVIECDHSAVEPQISLILSKVFHLKVHE